MKMKNCELCKGIARMHCESDRASLCWSCDYKVHSANFLVARHSRTLLCHVCQSATPWTAAGVNLGPTVSVCDSCIQNFNKINTGEEAANEEEDLQADMESDDFDDDEEEEDEEYDDDEGTDCEDNQVVPWSPSSPPPASPVANSPSICDEHEESYSSSSVSSRCDLRESQRKRTRENADLHYNVNFASRSPQENVDIPPATVAVSAAPADDDCVAGEERVGLVDSLSTVKENSLKKRRTENVRAEMPGSGSWAVIQSVKKLHKQEMRSTVAIAKLCRLTEDDPSAVDCDLSDSS